MKEFSAFEKRCILNVAKSVNPITKKINTLNNKIKALEEEQRALIAQIDAMEQTITSFTDGYTSDQLVNSTVKNGVTMYTFKYPDTIIPVQEENNNNNNNNNFDIF